MASEMPGNRALAGTRRSVNSDNNLAGWIRCAFKTFFRTHPRFFVSFGRAVKPNLLLLPAFVPAAKVGFLLPRAPEPAFAPVFVPLEWPLRWPQAGGADLVLRAPVDVPLAGRLDVPRAPLDEPFAACEPLRLPFVPFAAFGVQRVLDDAGREPFADRVPAGRAAEIRVSEAGRRVGRLPDVD